MGYAYRRVISQNMCHLVASGTSLLFFTFFTPTSRADVSTQYALLLDKGVTQIVGDMVCLQYRFCLFNQVGFCANLDESLFRFRCALSPYGSRISFPKNLNSVVARLSSVTSELKGVNPDMTFPDWGIFPTGEVYVVERDCACRLKRCPDSIFSDFKSANRKYLMESWTST